MEYTKTPASRSIGFSTFFRPLTVAVGLLLSFPEAVSAASDLEKELDFFSSPEFTKLEHEFAKADYENGIEAWEAIENLKVGFPSPTDQAYLDGYLKKNRISPKTIFKVKSWKSHENLISMQLLSNRTLTLAPKGADRVNLNGIEIKASGVSAERFITSVASALRKAFIAKNQSLILSPAFADGDQTLFLAEAAKRISYHEEIWRLDGVIKVCSNEMNKKTPYSRSRTKRSIDKFRETARKEKTDDLRSKLTGAKFPKQVLAREILLSAQSPSGKIKCEDVAASAKIANSVVGSRINDEKKALCDKLFELRACIDDFANSASEGHGPVQGAPVLQ